MRGFDAEIYQSKLQMILNEIMINNKLNMKSCIDHMKNNELLTAKIIYNSFQIDALEWELTTQ